MKKSKQTEENTVFEVFLLQEVKVFAMLKIM